MNILNTKIMYVELEATRITFDKKLFEIEYHSVNYCGELSY
jgi:hypothetical protein